jgi:hypothetical protein
MPDKPLLAIGPALACALLAAAGCSSGSDDSGPCRSTSECPPGRICLESRCVSAGDGGADADAPGDGDAPPEDGFGDDARIEDDAADDGLVEEDAADDGLVEDGAAEDGTLDDGADDGGLSCIPTESPEVTCDGLDNDCDGYVDDVDVGGDGFCDCLRIGVLGDPGTLASSSFQAWLVARGTSVVRFGLDAAPLTAEQLAAHDVVILDRLRRDYTAEEAAILRDFVAAGGGVMVMTGYTGGGEDRTRPNSLLAAIGLEYLPGLHNGPVTSFEVHPLTTGLTSVTFQGGYLVGEVAGVPGANTVVARLSVGPAGIAQERGAGRVFVWGDEWIQFDSEWTTLPEINQLWVNVMTWLGPRTRCLIMV